MNELFSVPYKDEKDACELLLSCTMRQGKQGREGGGNEGTPILSRKQVHPSPTDGAVGISNNKNNSSNSTRHIRSHKTYHSGQSGRAPLMASYIAIIFSLLH
jgi:hypothetical protein